MVKTVEAMAMATLNGITRIIQNKQEYFQDYLVTRLWENSLKLNQKRSHVRNI